MTSTYNRGHAATTNPSANPNVQADTSHISPEDYLEKQQVGLNLKEAISLLLENRPENPIQFLAEHFKNMHSNNTLTNSLPQQANGIVASPSNIMKAFRLLILSKQGAQLDQKCFSDNVFQAYQLIEKDHGSSGIKGFDLNKLARMLCIDFPQTVTQGILGVLDKRDEENVDFDEFLHSIKTILLFDNYFEELEPLFKHLDPSGAGRIRSQDLLDACGKLENEQTDLRLPPNAIAEKIYNRMVSAGNIDIPDFLSLAEYQILLFKATQDDE